MNLKTHFILFDALSCQEVESLCSSIALRQKYSKLEAKLRASLAEMEEERQRNLAEKVKQREELQAAAEEIRQVWDNSHMTSASAVSR